MLRGNTILITGGAGFIGSYLTERLLSAGNNVIVLDDFSEGKYANLAGVPKAAKLKVVCGDILNKKTVDELVKKVDYVFHLAVKCLGVSFVDPMMVHEVNVTGTLNLCMACLKHKTKRLIYVSSSEAYGTAQYVPMDENHPLCPTTPYGASKAAGEFYVQSFHSTWNLPVIIVRPFNAYGPRSRTDHYCAVIPDFVTRIEEKKPPIVFGDGNQTRDFTYVTDDVEGIIRAAECDELIGNTINVARGEEVSINKIAEIVVDLMGMTGKIKPVYKNERPGDVRRHLADISKARKLLGFEAEVSIEEGISRYIKWRRGQKNEKENPVS